MHWRFASYIEIYININYQWLSCSTMGLWDYPESKNQVGIEFTPGGYWFTLFRDASGKIVRGSGPDYEGKYYIVDTSPGVTGIPHPWVTGIPDPRVEITGAWGSLAIVSPAFSDSPHMMLLKGSRRTVTYVAAPLRRP
jgi:hypothetical protein